MEALCDWVRTAERDGEPLCEDPIVRSKIAQLTTELAVSRVLQRRVICEALKGGVPTVQAAEYKLFMTEFGKRVASTALDVMGAESQLKPDAEGAPAGGRFERSYRYTVVDSIGGGASEIQKNIIAGRGLGLPRTF